MEALDIRMGTPDVRSSRDRGYRLFLGKSMSKEQIIKLLLRAHYHLMDNPRFWYDKGLIEASKILCVRASDMRAANGIY